MKTEAVATGGELHRRRPAHRRVGDQAGAIKQPPVVQIGIPNTNQVDLPIFPNGHALDATVQ